MTQTTNTRSLRPDARLVQLHAERGNPGRRLAEALALLEDADWGMLFSGEMALARQLAALLGPGTLRVDGRLNISRSAFAEAGLAVADLYGDLEGARAAWLFEPDERTLERAARAGVKVIVDATLTPGGGWPARGADYVVYRDAVTLTGHADAPLAALFGVGDLPEIVAPAPSDLSVSLALRDVATLPLRLARAARTVSNVAERLGGAGRSAGPTALLLAPDAAPDTVQPLGGVLAATRAVPEGVLLTPGLEDTEQVLSLVRETRPAVRQTEERREHGAQSPARTQPQPRRERERDDRRLRFERRPERDRQQRPGRFEQGRVEQGRVEQGRVEQSRPGAARPEQPSRPESSRPEPSSADRPQADWPRPPAPHSPAAQSPAAQSPVAEPERFTFEAPASLPEETWEPEIVFSDIAQTPTPLTHTVSSGPDAPDQREGLPDVLHQPALAPAGTPEATVSAPAGEVAAADPEDAGDAAATVQPSAATLQAAKLVEQTPAEAPVITPDLPAKPAGKEDPASNLSDEQAAIYARLREWRNTEAKRQQISTFIIASNATLAEIARRIPYTEADLKAVKGMGPERMKKYGQKILEVVRG